MHLSFWKKDQKPKQRVDEGPEWNSGPPGMNTQGILSVVALVLGVLVLVVLTTLGGVAKQAVHDGIMSRLKYKLPDGYKNDPNYQECYRSTKGMFYDEYYLWNLTNPDAFLSGSKPDFNITGPYVYPQWFCNYDHSIDEEAGILRYRTILEGYRFIREQSASDDDVLITNINPAYAGIMQQVSSEANLAIVLAGGAIENIITTLQAPSTIAAVQLGVWWGLTQSLEAALLPSVTLGVASQVLSQVNGSLFWSPAFDTPSFQGWASYTLQHDNTTDVTIPSSAQSLIYAAWTNATTLGVFNSLNATTVASIYGVTVVQASWLLNYTLLYLSNPDTYGTIPSSKTRSILMDQWANSTSSTPFYPGGGWELGSVTNISVADATLLFNDTYTCSLANPSGIQTWLKGLAQQVNVLTQCPQYTLTSLQYSQILTWISVFIPTLGYNLGLHSFNLPDWSHFGYAQWGGKVTHQSFTQPAPDGSEWSVELAGSTTCILNYTESERILNGTNPPGGLFNYSNMVTFMTLYEQYALTQDLSYLALLDRTFQIDSNTAGCIALYVAYIIAPDATAPAIQQAKAAGSGLIVTRTVNEWLFNAFDPLLTLMQQDNDTSLVGNETISEDKANTLNYTYVRVYTGHNSLYWSLMPYNEGTVLPFWRGDNVTITGYNGTQFLPYNQINHENPGGHPLLLFHHLINRTVPFANIGSDTWEGVNVRYLTLDPLALASEVENPDNYPYYATYSGLINKTSNPPLLPVFLSPVNFHFTDPAVTENITWSDTIFSGYDPTDKLSRHRLSLFLLVEPELGSTVWGNLPIQMNLRFGPLDAYPNIVSGFAPIYWNAIGNIATTSDLNDVKTDLYANQRAWKALIGVGVGLGVLCMIGGIVGVHHYKKHKNELLDSSTIDSTTTSPKSSSATVSAYTG